MTCIYSCNFGNYRNEIKNIDNVQLYDNIDYYFFTDQPIKSKKWNVIETPLLTSEHMDSCRITSKYVKFVTPSILDKYDTIIWCDSKCIFMLSNILPLLSYFEKTNCKLIHLLHNVRKTIQEELVFTINNNIENKENGELFLKEVKSKIPLTNTCFIVRKNKEMNEIFKMVFQCINEKGLKRDQNVYCHVLHKMNIKKKDIIAINKV
jgi:hypothetical protein